MRLFDSHAHLNQPEFDADRAEMIARAQAAGIGQILTVGYNVASSEQAIEIAAAHPGVYAAVGIQPNDTVHAAAGIGSGFSNFRTRRAVVALGETGLDRYWDTSPLACSRIISTGTCGCRSSRGCRLSSTRARATPRCWPCCARRMPVGRWRA